MVNFGPLAAEIISLVWGTPGNFNGFRVLSALLHGTLVVNDVNTEEIGTLTRHRDTVAEGFVTITDRGRRVVNTMLTQTAR